MNKTMTKPHLTEAVAGSQSRLKYHKGDYNDIHEDTHDPGTFGS